MENMKENNEQKNFEIKINNENFIFNLGLNKDKKKIMFLIRTKNVFDLNYYKLESSFEELIKINKFFNAFESLEEIKEEFDKIISDSKNVTFTFENEKKIIKINFDFTFFSKSKKIELLLNKIELSNDIMQEQNDKIKEQEIKIKDLENSLQEYKANNDILKKILEEVKEIKIKINSLYIFEIDSRIIKNKYELDLIKNALKSIYHKEPKFKLLFRATRDGERVSDFHKHCDGIPNTLSIMEGIKGYSFGGYTESTWDSISGCKPGINQFLFSLDRMRVYMGRGNTTICCGTNYGPYFCGSCGMYDYYFSKNNNDEQKKGNKPYNNFTEEYELTHGDVHFYGKEVEVFQIIFA